MATVATKGAKSSGSAHHGHSATSERREGERKGDGHYIRSSSVG